MRTSVLHLAALLFFAPQLLPGQGREREIAAHSGNYFTKLVIEAKDMVVVETDSLLLDTLIMKDNANLVFLRGASCLAVAHAFIGNQCKFDAGGKQGSHGGTLRADGDSGSDGKSLTVSIRFEELGSLEVSTAGGGGGDGMRGLDGAQPGESGSPGGNGGRGGDAGNLSFFYLSPNFSIAFQEQRNHSVRFNTLGGKGGNGGMGGAPARNVAVANRREPFGLPANSQAGLRGRNGAPGPDGREGILRFLRTENRN